MVKYLDGLDRMANKVDTYSFGGEELAPGNTTMASELPWFSRAEVDQVERMLLNDNVPATRRFRDQGASVLLGAYTSQGVGVSRHTKSYADWLPALHRLAATRPKSEEYCSMQINEFPSLQVHTDSRNYGPNWVMSMGDYKSGGRVWVAHERGDQPAPDGSGLPGFYHECYKRWIRFDPSHPHAVEKVQGGRRLSVVCFNPSRLHALQEEHWDPHMKDRHIAVGAADRKPQCGRMASSSMHRVQMS